VTRILPRARNVDELARIARDERALEPNSPPAHVVELDALASHFFGV
jgi:hypothetical protein